jgi:mono/diheme cytochrome c family protein
MNLFIKTIIPLTLFFIAAGCGGETNETPEVHYTEGLKVRPLKDFKYERTAERIERGKYLTESVLYCFTCHGERDWTKPGAPVIEEKKGAGSITFEDDDYRMVAPNITPDMETGAGTWTDDMFARAIREGVGHDGRALGGTMFYWAFANLSDEDLASIIVYVRSLPPVKNKLPKRKVSLEQQKFYVKEPAPIYKPVLPPDFNNQNERGKYLVKIADCDGCHSAWEAPFNPGLLGGGNLIERMQDSVFSSNITFDVSGISYDENIFLQIVHTGKSGTLSGVMPWTVFKNMTDEDIKAIYAFLKTIKPVKHFVNNISPPAYCKLCKQVHGFGEYNTEFRAADVSPALYDDYTGKYMFKDSLVIKIYREDDKLMVKEGEYEPSECLPLSEKEFRYAAAGADITFERNKKNKVTRLVFHFFDEEIAEKIE